MQVVPMAVSTVERFILVIDANSEHVRTITTALTESQNPYRLVAIARGDEALEFLTHQGRHTTATRPDLILLDLDLPDTNGLNILTAIKQNAHLRRIPIIVFTVSDRAEDIFRSYALQGNCYVIKSRDLHNLSEIVQRIEEFWLGIVTLPVE